MNNAKRIAKNSVFQATAYIAKAGVTFLIYILLGRTAGADRLGDFATLITLAGVFSFVSAFGMPEFLIREIARLRDKPKQINLLILHSLQLTLGLSCLAIIGLIIVAPMLNMSGELFWASLFTGVALLFETIVNILLSYFRGMEEMQWSSLVLIVMELGFLLLTTTSVITGFSDLNLIMLYYAISRALAFVGAMWLAYSRKGVHLRWESNRVTCFELLKQSSPFALNTLMAFAYVRLDVVLLAFLTSNTTVGMYEAATSLAIRVNILARLVNQSMYPFLSAQFEVNEFAIRKHTGQTIRYLMIPGFFIMTIFVIFGDQVIHLLYGEQFFPAVMALQIMALIIPLRFIDNSLAVALTATNRQLQRSIAVTAAAGLNIALNFGLIPTYSMMGAVYATVFTEVVLFVFFVWYLRSEIRDMLPWNAFLVPLTGSILVILLYRFLIESISVIFLSVLVTLLYLGIITVFDRSSVRFFIKLMRRPA